MQVLSSKKLVGSPTYVTLWDSTPVGFNGQSLTLTHIV
jgi:hypothetical protein